MGTETSISDVGLLPFPKSARIDYSHKRSTVILPSTFKRSLWTLQPIPSLKFPRIKERSLAKRHS